MIFCLHLCWLYIKESLYLRQKLQSHLWGKGEESEIDKNPALWVQWGGRGDTVMRIRVDSHHWIGRKPTWRTRGKPMMRTASFCPKRNLSWWGSDYRYGTVYSMIRCLKKLYRFFFCANCVWNTNHLKNEQQRKKTFFFYFTPTPSKYSSLVYNTVCYRFFYCNCLAKNLKH